MPETVRTQVPEDMMGFKKYVNDYKLENVKDKNGKVVTKTVYRGDYFVYRYKGTELKNARTAVIACVAVALTSFVLGLVFYRNTGFTSQYYTLAPFLCCGFPLIYLCIAAFNVIRTGEGKKVDREHKDGIHDRIAKCLTAIMVLDGLGVSGIAVSAVLKMTGVEERPFTYSDAIFMAAAGTLLISAVLAFSPRKKLIMDKI